MLRIVSKTPLIMFSLLFLLISFGHIKNTAQAELPRPKLVFMGRENTEKDGRAFTLYRLNVENKSDYPNELFAAAPELPPCGSNKNSSRSWVDIYSQKAGRLYGFCALKSPSELNRLAFILPKEMPLDYVYIIIYDRKLNREYKSTLVSTMDF